MAEEDNVNTKELSGQQINEAYDEQKSEMRAARLRKTTNRAEGYAERLKSEQDRAREVAEVAAGRALPYPCVDLETAAKWIGTSAQRLKNLAQSLPMLQAVTRSAPDGSLEFFSGALQAHKVYLEKLLGVQRSPFRKAAGRAQLSVFPSRDEIIKFASLKIKGE